MNLVSVNKISRIEGGKLLFNEISFGIEAGEKIALMGNNGCGKSTLLYLISKRKEPDSGEISRRKKLNIVFLEQKNEYDSSQSLLDFILSGDSPIMALIKEYEKALELQSGELHNNDVRDLSIIMEEMDRQDGWLLEHKVKAILDQLSLTQLTHSMKTLSGGMVKKAMIAQALVQDADLIILDEPTNHLDIETIQWLENYLKGSKQALLLVTHDRTFMDTVCTKIIEIEDQTLYTYPGNYSSFIGQKEKRMAANNKAQNRLTNQLRREIEWLERGPKARSSKDRGRKERIYNMMDEQEFDSSPTAQFSTTPHRLGGKVLNLTKISKKYDGKNIILPFSHEFRKSEKIGIIGNNGSGKTTFLNLVTEKIATDGGTIDKGLNTHMGYFSQDSFDLPKNDKVLEYISSRADQITLEDGSKQSATQFLQKFNFPSSQLNTLIKNLSGGEQRRLYLIKILIENPNFLILDEPTNDFDITTLQLLEEFLSKYSGCLIIVSHDRWFLERTTNFLFVFDGSGGINGYGGSVADYYKNIKITPEKSIEKSNKSQKDEWRQPTLKKKLSFKEKHRLEEIEHLIENLEIEKNELENFFGATHSSLHEIKEKKKRYQKLDQEIDHLINEWEILEIKKENS